MSGQSPDDDGKPAHPRVSQDRIGTGLVSRDVDESGAHDDGLRIGGYIVFRDLALAPGVRMAEARDVDGQRVLLQLARCRRADSKDQREQRQDYIRMVASATEHLTQDDDLVVFAHGAADEPDGARTLFWALPWVDGCERLGRAASDVKTLEQLVAVATSLMERLAQRHQRGRLEPLLSEQLLVLRPTGAAVLIGVPIHLPDEWIARDAPPARLAPEERETGEPTAKGDLWRAGLALRALAGGVDVLPDVVSNVIEALAAANPDQRPPSAQDVLVELESLDGTLAASQDPSRPAENAPARTVEEAAPPMTSVSSQEAAAEPVAEPEDWSLETLQGDPLPAEHAEALRAVADRGASKKATPPDDVRSTVLDEPMDDVRQTVLDELGSSDGPSKDLPSSAQSEPSPDATPLDVLAHDTSFEANPMGAQPRESHDDAETDAHAKADIEAVNAELAAPVQRGTASEQPTKPPGIWTRAKEQQTIRVPYPESDKRTTEPREQARPEEIRDTNDVRFGRLPAPTSIPEAPTLLDAKRPKQRHTFTKGADTPNPNADPNFTKTLIDEPMPDLSTDASDVVLHTPDAAPPLEGATANDPASEMTLRDVSRADLERMEHAHPRGDESEFPTMDDSLRRRLGPPTKRTVWDTDTPSHGVSAAAAAAGAMGPKGTVVGVRLIHDPTGLRPVPNLPRLLPPGGQMTPPVGLLPPGPDHRNDDLAAQIPKGATIAGQPALLGDPALLALRARSIQAAESDQVQVPQGGWPAEERDDLMPAARRIDPAASHEGMMLRPPPRDLPAIPAQLPRPSQSAPPMEAQRQLPAPMEAPRAPSQDLPRVSTSRPSHSSPSHSSPSHSAPSMSEPPPKRSPAWFLIGALLFFATGGGVALGLSLLFPRSSSPTANLGKNTAGGVPAQTKPYAIGPASEVVLEASPRDAKVVAERTGRVLGTTPLRFLVPQGVPTAVLVAADGYEPQRLVLPDRGRISTDLVPLGKNEHCRVSITAPEGVGLEGFGGEVEVGTRFRIPGSVVLRSEGHGAWLVRCPKFGGSGDVTLERFPAPRDVSLEVTGPWGAEIKLNGEVRGKVPVTVDEPIDYYEVTAKDDKGSVSRWLPLVGNTQLKMPEPRRVAATPPSSKDDAVDEDDEEDDDKPTKKRRRRRRKR